MGLVLMSVDSIFNLLGFVTHQVLCLPWLMESTYFAKQYTQNLLFFPGENSSLYNLGSTLYETEHKIMNRKEITTRYLI